MLIAMLRVLSLFGLLFVLFAVASYYLSLNGFLDVIVGFLGYVTGATIYSSYTLRYENEYPWYWKEFNPTPYPNQT